MVLNERLQVNHVVTTHALAAHRALQSLVLVAGLDDTLTIGGIKEVQVLGKQVLTHSPKNMFP